MLELSLRLDTAIKHPQIEAAEVPELVYPIKLPEPIRLVQVTKVVKAARTTEAPRSSRPPTAPARLSSWAATTLRTSRVGPGPRVKLGCPIQALHPDVVCRIVSHFNLRDVACFRATCIRFRQMLDPMLLGKAFGCTYWDLVATSCTRCLRRFPDVELIQGEPPAVFRPYNRMCLPCAGRAQKLAPGMVYRLQGGGQAVSVCHWCRYPLLGHGKQMRPECPCHAECLQTYRRVVAMFYAWQVLHLVAIAGATVLSIVLLSDEFWAMTCIPCNFAWTFFAMVIMRARFRTFRNNRLKMLDIRSYHWSCSCDATILALWHVPLTGVSLRLEFVNGPRRSVGKAALCLIALCCLQRLTSLVGHGILLRDKPIWHPRIPTPRRRRLVNLVMVGFVLLVNPYCFEQNYPGTMAWDPEVVLFGGGRIDDFISRGAV
ncbi:hypothetical protein ESCO_001817 [Escovopsis weberi]|uniref:F-box domain-containing protein n=1 Tax=Escovopsis weberi TaxID=150374 RepID=A0A0M9VWS9_ESCWE|nr:hypothetical protein ESCO_001817 [Escovopsis weberi]